MKIFKLLSFIVFIYVPLQSIYSFGYQIQDKFVTFSYFNKTAHEVKLLTSLDNYEKYFYLEKNTITNNWTISIDASKDFGIEVFPNQYYYRYIVDGVYIIDPSNPDKILDPKIGFLSVIDVKNSIQDVYKSFIKLKPLKYRFFFRKDSITSDVTSVMLVGDFNHWKPYQYILKELDHRFFYVDVPFFEKGQYSYQYIVNAENWVYDKYNPDSAYNKIGEKVSIIIVE